MGQNILCVTGRDTIEVGDLLSTTSLHHFCGDQLSPSFPLSFCIQLQQSLVLAQAPD